MTSLELYLIYRLDAIMCVMAYVFIISFLLFISLQASSAWLTMTDRWPDDKEANLYICKLAKAIFLLALVSMVVAVCVPSTKEYLSMKVLPAVCRGENVKEKSPEIYQMAVQHLREKTGE